MVIYDVEHFRKHSMQPIRLFHVCLACQTLGLTQFSIESNHELVAGNHVVAVVTEHGSLATPEVRTHLGPVHSQMSGVTARATDPDSSISSVSITDGVVQVRTLRDIARVPRRIMIGGAWCEVDLVPLQDCL